MKKLFVIAVFFLAALVFFCGCSKQNEKIVIGVSVPAADHGWTAGVAWSAENTKAEVEKKYPGVKIVIVTAKDSAEQVKGLESLLMKRVDALIVMTHDPVPLVGICKKAQKQGIYTVFVSNPVPGVKPDVFVTGSNRFLGVAAAQAIGKRLNGKGDVALMKGQPCPIDNERVGGFKETLAKDFPEIRIIGEGDTHWRAEKGFQLMEIFLQKNKQIDAVWAGDDDILSGALMAYEKSGRKDIKAFVGGGGSKFIVKKILDGDPLVYATVTYPPYMISTGIDAAVDKLVLHKTPQAEITITSEIVTTENA